MIQRGTSPSLADLYHSDETGWMEQMADLAAHGETSALELTHLSEFLTDVARRDKREVL